MYTTALPLTKITEIDMGGEILATGGCSVIQWSLYMDDTQVHPCSSHSPSDHAQLKEMNKDDTGLTVSAQWVLVAMMKQYVWWIHHLITVFSHWSQLLPIQQGIILRVLVCQWRIWGLSPHCVSTTHPGSCS